MFENGTNLTSPMLFTSFDQLLDSLSFNEWVTIVTLFVMPIISLICLIMCSLSAWIFFQKKFHRPRLHLLSTTLSCLHFTTGSWHSFGRFIFESFSTAILLVLYNSMFVIYYHLLAGLLFHFEDTLLIGHFVNTHENIQFVCEKTFHAKASTNCFKSFSNMSFHR